MCGGGNPLSAITDPLRDLGAGVVSGISNAGNKFLDETTKGIKGVADLAIDTSLNTLTGGAVGYRDGQVGSGVLSDQWDKAGREIGRGLGEVSGKNTFEREMQRISDRQEAESNRLLWERDNKMAQSKEADAQAEARKRMRASQVSGRTGTILTGFEQGASTQLGAGGGKDLLGA